MHDNGIIDDLPIFIEHGGILGASNIGFGDVVHKQAIQKGKCILSFDFHQVVGPAIPAGVFPDSLMLGACDGIFAE